MKYFIVQNIVEISNNVSSIDENIQGTSTTKTWSL